MSTRVKLDSGKRVQKVNVRRLWTLHDLTRVFHRSMQTVLNWRANEGLPCIEIPGSLRPAIRYEPKAVLKWALEHDKDIYQVKRA